MSDAKRVLTAVALLALLVPAGPAAADLGEMKHRFSSERIDLSLEDADIVSVLDIYRKVLGVEVRLQCAEERRVTITFSNLTVRTSLDAICESAGLVWSLEEGEPPILRVDCGLPPLPGTGKATKPAPGPGQGMVAVPRAAAKGGADPLSQTVSIELQDADLADTLAMMGRLLGGSGNMRPARGLRQHAPARRPGARGPQGHGEGRDDDVARAARHRLRAGRRALGARARPAPADAQGPAGALSTLPRKYGDVASGEARGRRREESRP